MTAFARIHSAPVVWEIRSVNQRYLDLNFRLPDTMRQVEPDLRNRIREQVHRGKVDCVLRLDAVAGEFDEPILDRSNLDRLTRLLDHLASVSKNLSPVNPLELLKWPGILTEEAEDFDALVARVKTSFADAVTTLVSARETEGRALTSVIGDRLDHLEAIVASIRAAAPDIERALLDRLRARLGELAVDVDQGRLEQELVFLAQKADIAEELDRLDTHVTQVRETLNQTGPVGRRLDFLMQELNREANTLSSKSAAADTSVSAVELKVIIEQMREQIQNIE